MMYFMPNLQDIAKTVMRGKLVTLMLLLEKGKSLSILSSPSTAWVEECSVKWLLMKVRAGLKGTNKAW